MLEVLLLQPRNRLLRLRITLRVTKVRGKQVQPIDQLAVVVRQIRLIAGENDEPAAALDALRERVGYLRCDLGNVREDDGVEFVKVRAGQISRVNGHRADEVILR